MNTRTNYPYIYCLSNMKCLKLKKVAASSRRVTFCNLLGTGQLTSTTVFYNVFFFQNVCSSHFAEFQEFN